jgi:hypothetical protein
VVIYCPQIEFYISDCIGKTGKNLEIIKSADFDAGKQWFLWKDITNVVSNRL